MKLCNYCHDTKKHLGMYQHVDTCEGCGRTSAVVINCSDVLCIRPEVAREKISAMDVRRQILSNQAEMVKIQSRLLEELTVIVERQSKLLDEINKVKERLDEECGPYIGGYVGGGA